MFTSLSLIVTASLAAPLQDPERLDAATSPAFDPGALASVTDTLLLDEPGDGRVWARGRQYKASFGADGFTYIPFLGSDAPQNYPVTFDVASATVGGDPLPLERASAPSLDGESVTLGRGALDEVYHLTNESVEQTFVFGALPSAGELRVRMDVTTELGVTALGGGFAFTNDLGQVRYGAATAVDADGRTLALEQTWTGSGIEVAVPAEFVANASLPLVIDPVVSTFGVTADSREQVDVDTAFDSQNNTYQIVYGEMHSLGDFDVLTVFYNASLDLLVQPSSIDISSDSWSGPRTASAYEEQTFLCVASVGIPVEAARIRGRTRHAATGARSAQFDISGTFATNCDVGGYGNDAGSSWDFVVVWQQGEILPLDFDVRAQAVSAQATLVGSAWPIANDPDHEELRPAISKSTGRIDVASVDHEYMVVWEREESPTNHDIWARVIERSGNTIGHPEFRAYSFSDARAPDVSVQSDITYSGLASQHWAIAFERLLGSDYDVFVVMATDGDADNARNVPDMQNLHDEQRDQLDPSLAFDGRDYLLAYRSENEMGGFDGYLTAFNVMHQNGELRIGLTERRAALRPEDGETRVVAVASHYDGGGVINGGLPGDGLAVWIAKDRFGPDDEAGASVVAEISDQTVGTQFCTANDNASGVSAWIEVEQGPLAVLPTSQLTLRCIDLPLNAFGHFIVSNEEAFTPNPAGSAGNLCLTGSIGRYSNSILDSGTTGEVFLDAAFDDIPGPFGSRMAMAGDLWYFQYWTRDVAGGVATSNFSNACVVYVH